MMLEVVRFQFRLKNLQKRKRVLESKYDEAIKVAQGRKDRKREENIISEAMFERDYIDDAISNLSSRHVRLLAERYLIPIPEFDTDSSDWIESKIDGRFRLSDQAIATLRSDIRRERKERHEHTLMWLAALTGIIGALTGLVVVIQTSG